METITGNGLSAEDCFQKILQGISTGTLAYSRSEGNQAGEEESCDNKEES